MGIQNFPAALQPIIQQGFLERRFAQALRASLAYRGVADKERFPNGVGETITKTRAGLKPAVTTALSPSSNTNLDNGLSPSGWGVEQYTLTVNMYGDSQDLNMVTSRVAIVPQFVQNAYVNGEQAARSLDTLARNALFGVYIGGNTRVRTTLGAAGPTISVDDVTGFQYVWVNGVQTPVSSGNPLSVTIGSNVYNIGTVAVDGSNVSTTEITPGSKLGKSGTLTTVAGNITVADGTAGNAVVAATGCGIVRAGGRATTAALTAGDTLAMANLLDAKAKLELNAVPRADGGFYHCYLDAVSARQLFADPDFKVLFQGATAESAAFRAGEMANPFLGLRFFPSHMAPSQTAGVSGFTVRRPIICGQGALVEGAFEGMANQDVRPADSIISMVDGVVMVTREPLDRLQQIIGQSWYWIGGYSAPTDTTASASVVPTATNAAYKRAVVIEHAG